MNLKYLKIFWVIIQDDKYIIDELYLKDVLNIVDYETRCNYYIGFFLEY